MDLYSFDFKLGHIAKHVQLPPAPQLGDLSGVPREERLPPLLVVNIQLPDYPVRRAPASDIPALVLHAVPRKHACRPADVASRLLLGIRSSVCAEFRMRE